MPEVLSAAPVMIAKGRTRLNYLHILTLIFITLKLIHILDWSWWLILAPSLVAIVIPLVVITAVFITASSKVKRGLRYTSHR